VDEWKPLVSGYRVGVLRTRNGGVLQANDNLGYFCAVPGPMQFALSEMLEDTAWVDAYLAENLTNLVRTVLSKFLLV
jgi:1-aminocyclopropane-1-carboxylate synthase